MKTCHDYRGDQNIAFLTKFIESSCEIYSGKIRRRFLGGHQAAKREITLSVKNIVREKQINQETYKVFPYLLTTNLNMKQMMLRFLRREI